MTDQYPGQALRWLILIGSLARDTRRDVQHRRIELDRPARRAPYERAIARAAARLRQAVGHYQALEPGEAYAGFHGSACEKLSELVRILERAVTEMAAGDEAALADALVSFNELLAGLADGLDDLADILRRERGAPHPELSDAPFVA